MGGNLLSFIDLLGFYCDLDGFYVAVIRTLEVTSKGEYTIGTQHLEQEVRVMRYDDSKSATSNWMNSVQKFLGCQMLPGA